MNSNTHGSPAGPFDKLLIMVGIIGVAVSILAVFVVINGGGTGSAETGASGEAKVQTAHYELTEFSIDGDNPIGPGPTRFEVHNGGALIHNLVFEGGPSTPDLNNEESAVLDVGDLEPGTYSVFCSISGHREAGMETTIIVTEGAKVSDGGHQDTEDIDWDALDDAMTQSMLAFPAETEGKGNQEIEPTIQADGTKEYHLTAAITKWEVEPGKLVDAWTYNGMVPGPQIRVDLGDKVRVILENQLPMGTDIHWHGIHTPNNMDGVAPLTQDLIKSGETFVYEFEAINPAVGMYHAHHHGHVQIPNGLFGVFLIGDIPLPRGRTVSGIEIPQDLEVTHEIPMVLNDAGVIGLSLNGKSFPATEPYVGQVGDWVVVHYYNEGLQSHPMHQHQFPQLIFAKDGIPLDNPYWADTVNIAPGERYSVLLRLSDPGVWVWHCHILTHVERDAGMFGMVTAWIVEDA
jgi:FtsP/CotA-like multicopper oxidase with cupredoxin domain